MLPFFFGFQPVLWESPAMTKFQRTAAADIGVGVGLRRKHFDPALAELDTPSAASPDWFEVLPENFFPFG
ncbi:MAG: hypothetical protein ACI9MR_002001, partial [Myxococcota bacterium]